MKKNISLAEKIKFRMNNDWTQPSVETKMQTQINKEKKENVEKGFFCLYNHLTPNRNLIGFDYHFSNCSNLNKINKYYKKIVEYDLSLKKSN